MPATITEDPLGIACVFSDGTTAQFSLDGLPNPELARDLLVGLVELIHPHGSMDAAGSVGHFAQSVRDMTRKLAGFGFTGRAADLQRLQLAEYWMAASGPREACTRRMLQAFHAVIGDLDARVAEFTAGRRYNIQPSRRPLPPYREAEWDRLTQTCRTLVDESFAAHQQALAAGGRHPNTGGWTPANLRWLLARLGPVSCEAFAAEVGCTVAAVQQRGGFSEANRDMFPYQDSLIAYRLLFGIYSGIVPDGIDDLVVDDIDWAGDATILLSYVKGRTAAESLTLPRRAVRLLQQWLAHSALLRSFADEQERRQLWLGLSHAGHHVAITGSSARSAIQRWVVRHGVKNDDGGPLKIHRSRIRTTHHAMRDTSSWAGRGRATIDPNHSPHVEGDHYLTATTPTQQRAVEAIVEDAQHDLLRRAHPPTVVTDEDAAALAHEYPRLVASLELDDTAIIELLSGERDVFTAACADQLSGLHGPMGKPCPARPWVCLLCPLAVFAPRHARNLLRQGVLLPAVAADAGRAVHGRVRSVLPADRAGPGPFRRHGAVRGQPARRRPRPRGAPASGGVHPMTTAFAAADPGRSPFSGADVCREAGLTLPSRARRPVFDDDMWDFTEVIGLPTQMARFSRRFDFAAISDSRWRLVAKEQIMAMLAPRHEAVAPLPRAYRTPLHLMTASCRLAELTRFLNWLTNQGVEHLAEVDERGCEEYLAHRRYVRDENDVVVGELSPATRRAAAQTVVDLITHRELFTADRVTDDLRPWGGAAPSCIAEMPCGRGHNKTPPLEDSVLQPMLAAANYLVTALGPRVIELARQVRQADDTTSVRSGHHATVSHVPESEFAQLLADYERNGEPLPTLPDHNIRDRLATGWSADDPLTPLALGLLARQAGITQFSRRWTPHLRSRLEATLRVVGAAKPFSRNAASIDRADGEGTTAWTLPLDRYQAVALIGIVRTAAITVIAAISGMRASELMELRVGCRRPPEEFGPGLIRYRLASKVIKGQALGGIDDEWVVIEPVYQAAELIEQLHPNPVEGRPLLGRFAFDVRYTWFRNWVNGPAGQRLGLAPIPETRVNLRTLRRTLAIELAYRPGGVLATKIHLKHVAVATTEGYASRPGGAQAELLAEVNKHEAERNLELVWAEFRNYQQGVMPAGPGARELTEFFAHVDGKLTPTDAGSPKVQRNNREVLNLLTKRANTLHLGTANYCWFTDPSRALCLKLAGTPNAEKPLAGMCDSARCPQATHHPCHRPVWAEHAEQTTTFLGDLGPTRKTERARLHADLDRAQRVLDAIDIATDGPSNKE